MQMDFAQPAKQIVRVTYGRVPPQFVKINVYDSVSFLFILTYTNRFESK